MGTRLNYSGLVIAGIGFFVTRFTVALAIYEDPVRFYLAGVVPLALGLGLAAFGVALAVADVEASVVRTTALWCVVGTGAMLVLVVLTLLGSTTGGMPEFATVRLRGYLSNFLVGGSVGGTLTGLYAASNRRRHSELRRQAHRLEVLNRLLRHEVLNAVSVIRGYASMDGAGDLDVEGVIEERSDAIERTIDEVKYLTRHTGTGGPSGVRVDLGTCLTGSVETVTDRYPDARISVGNPPEDLTVRADERLEQVLVHLLENAVRYTADDGPRVEVSVTTTANTAHISVSDEGPGLPESQQRLLETGEIQDFDDPGSGFGLNIVRLLVEGYEGSFEADVDGTGTTITVVLPRAEAGSMGFEPSRSSLAGLRPAVPHLTVILVAAIIAGISYGVVAEHLGGSVAAIGVFYGIEDATVGWLTHEFHSVVFGFVFAGLVSLAPDRYRGHVPTYAAIGTAWALFLWIVAAGIVAPAWLRLLGIPAPIPNVSPVLLPSHLAWGVSLGVLTAAGYEYATPWIARLDE